MFNDNENRDRLRIPPPTKQAVRQLLSVIIEL